MKYLTTAALCLTLITPPLTAQDAPPPAAANSATAEGSTAAEGSEPAPNPEAAALVAKVDAFKYKTGDVPLQANRATLKLPDGYRFLGPQDSRTVIEALWGNPPGSASSIEGMILPRGQEVMNNDSWAIVVKFEDDGYVSDEDADSIDYADLLKTMKEQSAESSKAREAAGYGIMELTGWALPPRYDKTKKVLYWAKEFNTGGPERSMNYDVRVLGRAGVLSLNAVAAASMKKEIDAMTPEIVSIVSFNKGHTYAEFDASTDKKADYTLAGLVVGGAVAAKLLAKGGIAVLIAKFGKLLIIPIIALFPFLKKKFGKQSQ